MNIPHIFFIFPFFEIFRGAFAPLPRHHPWVLVMKPQKSNPMDLYYKLTWQVE